MALDSRNGEAGDLGGGDFSDSLSNEFRCATPTGAKSQCDVMMRNSCALGDDLRRLGGKFSR